MKTKILSLLLLFAIVQTNCRKNDTTTPPENETVNDAATITSSIKGVIVNENEMPVMGAIVTLGGNTVTTNALGAFEFRNKSMSQNNAHVKVEKQGYFTGNRTTMTSIGRTQLMRIKLIPKINIGTVAASSGGAVRLPSGGKVTFQQSAFTDAAGAAYSGTVNVAMAWINPTANDLAQTVPGDLRGITTAGGEMALETFGMLGVEITNTAGQKLKLATGKPAELRFPIPSALQAAAPATIPLWNFDEATGRWEEEGSANKVGNEYVGNVAHFSFWNADIPANYINLCVTVLGLNNQPLNNVQVRIRKASSPAISATGYTDSAGVNCGSVFKNEPLILEVLDRCGNVVYTQNIGPYSANASVTVNAVIPSNNVITISGTLLNCSNMPVTRGSVVVTTSGSHTYTSTVNSNGTFSISVLNCNSNAIFYTVTGIDYTTLQQSAPFASTGISGNVSIGNLQACGTTAEYIQAIVDGTPISWVRPLDSIASYIVGSPEPPYAFASAILGSRGNTGTINSNSVQFIFSYNNNPGISLLNSVIISYWTNGSANTSHQINSANPTVNLTTIGAPATGFLIGSFSGTMLFNQGNVTRNVHLSFKVRRT